MRVAGVGRPKFFRSGQKWPKSFAKKKFISIGLFQPMEYAELVRILWSQIAQFDSFRQLWRGQMDKFSKLEKRRKLESTIFRPQENHQQTVLNQRFFWRAGAQKVLRANAAPIKFCTASEKKWPVNLICFVFTTMHYQITEKTDFPLGAQLVWLIFMFLLINHGFSQYACE